MNKRSIHLVQRIEAARGYLPDGTPTLVEYYSGERSKERRAEFKPTIELLNCLIPLDYMGSAEFEFGTVPECLQRMSRNRKKAVPFEHIIAGRPYCFHPEGKDFGDVQTVTLKGWCQKGDEDTVYEFLTAEAHGDVRNKYHLKERSAVQEGAFGLVEWDRSKDKKPNFRLKKGRVCGWLDVENDWFCGTDVRQMNNFAYLLGFRTEIN